jgi:hypothetical protein
MTGKKREKGDAASRKTHPRMRAKFPFDRAAAAISPVVTTGVAARGSSWHAVRGFPRLALGILLSKRERFSD